MLFNVSCATKEIVPDTSRWNSYCSEVVDYLICYKLLGNFKEIIAPKKHVMLNDKSNFANIFDVGYDYNKKSFDLPKFIIYMQIDELRHKQKKINFTAFTKALAEHINIITKNSTKPSDLKPDIFKSEIINDINYAVVKHKKNESYNVLIGNKYFITIGSTYGMYSNVSSKWKIEREKIFNNIINSISLKKLQN